MDKLLAQFQGMLAGFSMVRKISMLVVLGLSVGGISYLVHVSNRASMEPLFTNLNAQDMGSILTRLDKQGVRYDVDQEQRTILVPATEVLDIRLKLAGEGLPRYGGIGFEIFDKGGFGLSDFEQKVNFQRALEGELSRTIGSMKEVENARVHLVLPEKSLFAESQQAARASVIIKMGGSGKLSENQVNSITHLVASSVESLDPSQVTVVDTAGRLLTSGTDDPAAMASNQAFDQKAAIEKQYEHRIVELLSPVVGLGKVMARVTANIDFTRTESTDEIVDPAKTAVVSESRTTAKKSESASGAGGAAGAQANTGGGGSSSAGNSGTSDEGSEQINYQVSKSIRRQITPMGTLKSLSVAVLVDGTYEDKEGTKTFVPRPTEELTKLDDLIKKAIGFSSDRGDQVKIETMAFQQPETDLTAASEAWYQKKTTFGFLISVIGNVLVVIMALLVFLFVIRPMARSWGGKGGLGAIGPGGVPLLEGGQGGMDQLVRTDPMAAANAIKKWLK